MSTPVLIPVDTTLGFYTQSIALDGVTYILSFRYNSHMDRWIMDIADASGNPLIYGNPILTQWAAGSRFKGVIPGLPPGPIVALDLTGNGADPTEFTIATPSLPLFYIGA